MSNIDLDDLDFLGDFDPTTAIIKAVYEGAKPIVKEYSNEADRKKLIRTLKEKISYASNDAERRVYKKILDQLE